MRTRLLFVWLAFACMLLTASTIGAETTWHFPTPISASAFVTKHHLRFAEEVKRQTDGELNIVAHPAGSLFKAADIFRAVRTGQVQIGVTGLFLHSAEEPIFALSDLPFIVKDVDEARDLIVASRMAIESVLEERNLKLIYTAIWNPTGLFSTKQLEGPDDLESMRIRTYNNTTTRFVQLVNGIPTKTEPSEIAIAFSTAVIDGSFGSGVTGVSQSLWDYIDYYYTTAITFPTSSVFVNLEAWNQLDAKTQATVLRIGAQTELAVSSEAASIDATYNETMRKAGMEVGNVPPELAAHFDRIGKQMEAEWLQATGEVGSAILQRLRSR